MLCAMPLTTRAFVLSVASVAGCAANTSGNTNSTCDQLAAAAAAPMTPWKDGTVFTIVMENHSRGQIFGSSKAPFINSLAAHYAVAADYHDSYVHPSEPNYFWMVAGQNFGVLDDGDPSSHHLDATSHVADQIEASGLTWRSYQESMGEPCGLTSHGRYAAKHDPFVYFDDVNGWDGTEYHPDVRCNDHVVDYTELDADIAAGKVPRYAFITPNLDDDMHDGSIAQGDAWLANEIPKIMASEAYKNGGVIFLLWDEGGGWPTADDPPFIAISRNAVAGLKSKVNYDTTSYLRTVQNILGVQVLPCAGEAARSDAASMTDLFTVALTAGS
jgi:phospholipase C